MLGGIIDGGIKYTVFFFGSSLFGLLASSNIV